MVTYALVVITDALSLKECHGQPQQLLEVVTKDIDVYARAHVQAHPAGDESHAEGAEEESQLRQHEVEDDAEVTASDAVIHQVLRDKRSYQREEYAKHHREGEHAHLCTERPYVFLCETPEAVLLFHRLVVIEGLRRLYGNYHSLVAVEPVLGH